MTTFTVLVHRQNQEAIAAHRPGTPWGSMEAMQVNGAWVGIGPWEVAHVDVDLSVEPAPETVPVIATFGVVDAPWHIFKGAV